MKKMFGAAILLLLVCSMMFSCKLSTTELAEQVQQAMIESWEESEIDLEVSKSLILVKQSDTEYSGLMTVSDGEYEEQITVNVIYDGDYFQWEIEGY
jgi:hypothetical protein